MTASHLPQEILLQRHRALSVRVGNTPLIALPSLTEDLSPEVTIMAKLEWHQIGGSVKARAAHAILGEALLHPEARGKRMLDASSGNTGIAYGAICAALDIPLTLCLPSNASPERKRILEALGVEIIPTSPFEGTDGAQAECRSIMDAQSDRYFYLDQYSHPANRKAHYHGTAGEIWIQTGGEVTHFVAGLGTTGTFNGTTSRLRAFNPDIQCIAFQPESALHGLEGWKHLDTADVPAIHDHSIADDHRTVSTESAYDMVVDIAQTEGLLISPSAGANLAAARSVAEGLERGTIVTTLADDASKYGEVMAQLF
ncbi:MAG: cysteine synthase family protein [Flavobacteriales bacterium]|nr:cysteine synthase family protein [Flavobacteriales bacterium]